MLGMLGLFYSFVIEQAHGLCSSFSLNHLQHSCSVQVVEGVGVPVGEVRHPGKEVVMRSPGKEEEGRMQPVEGTWTNDKNGLAKWPRTLSKSTAYY
jgi:hypothetical protein